MAPVLAASHASGPPSPAGPPGPPVTAPDPPVAAGRGGAQRTGGSRAAAGWLGLGLSTNLSARGRPHPFRLLDAHPGAFDYVEYSAPLEVEEARRQAALFGTLWERRDRVPALFHPVHLNLYGPELESEEALAALAGHARAVGSPWVSNDVGWWHAAGRFFPGYLYIAPPLSPEGLADCVAHVEHVRAALDRPLAVENPVVVARRGGWHVLEFMAELHRKTGSPLILDLGHLLAFQLAAGLPPEAGLEDFPLEAVIEIHLAGGLVFRREGRGVYHDAHPQPVREELFALLESVLPRCPALRGVTYEADGHPDAVALLHLERLRKRVPPPAAPPSRGEPGAANPQPTPGGGGAGTAGANPRPTSRSAGAGGESGAQAAPTASRPWEVLRAAYTGSDPRGPGASPGSPEDAGPTPAAHTGTEAARTGAEAERDLRLTTLAEALERRLPLTRWLAAGDPAVLRAFAASPEMHEGFRPPGRDVERSFVHYLHRQRHAQRQGEPDAAGETVLGFERWAHALAAAGGRAAPGPGCVALAPGVGFGVFPVDLTELVYAVAALGEALRRHAEASARFEAGALEGLAQVARRAPRRPWPVAVRTDRGRLEIVPVQPGLAAVLERAAAAGGTPAEPLVQGHPGALRAALAEGLVRAGPPPERDRLAPYRSKRDFRRSPEPRGGRRGSGGDGNGAPRLRKTGNPIFVIQEHDASSHHFDFRLEVEGVLRSWAVPKGPSTDPRDKRLAVAVEDHPLDYADFEGVIPEGEYGAGTVLVWDAGPYRNLSRDDGGNELSLAAALERGQAEFWLEGRKLRGGYALVHSKLGGKDENWLLVKMKDAGADARRNPTSTEPRSVLSGRTLAEVAQEQAEADAGEGGHRREDGPGGRRRGSERG